MSKPKRFHGPLASGDASASTTALATDPKGASGASGAGGASGAPAGSAGGVRRKVHNQIPDAILHNEELNKAIAVLPSNYSFEIHKTIWRIQQADAMCVALQLPEGLQMFACMLCDIIETFTGADTVILGDVTYGACCVDDLTAKALGADFLVHYGHSCLVPIDQCTIPVMYVFVNIAIDVQHLVDTVVHNHKDTALRMAVVCTIQFSTAVQEARLRLREVFPNMHVPQAKPLSPGEVLGCTSPNLPECEAIVYVGDGRFHLESVAMANPGVPTYRYDPYDKQYTRERFDHSKMMEVRRGEVDKAARATHFGVVLGTLGRQGNPHILQRIEGKLREKGIRHTVFLLSEVFPSKLALMRDIDAWIQVACPRLSTDWGTFFHVPLLNPYEAIVALDAAPWRTDAYPMDFYAHGAGPWGNYYETEEEKERKNAEKAARKAAFQARRKAMKAKRRAAKEKTSA